LVLIYAYDMWYTCLEENLTNLLWVTTCDIHELKRCLCWEIRCLCHCSKCFSWPSWCVHTKAWCHVIYLLSFELFQLILNIRYHVLEITGEKEFGSTILVLENEHISLSLIFEPSLLVPLIKTLSVLEPMAWEM
jgi:hypothetical protein